MDAYKELLLRMIEDKAIMILANGFRNAANQDRQKTSESRFIDDGVPAFILSYEGIKVKITLNAEYVDSEEV